MRRQLAVAVLTLSAAVVAQSPRVLVLADPAATTALQRELAPLIELEPTTGVAALSMAPSSRSVSDLWRCFFRANRGWKRVKGAARS